MYARVYSYTYASTYGCLCAYMHGYMFVCIYVGVYGDLTCETWVKHQTLPMSMTETNMVYNMSFE